MNNISHSIKIFNNLLVNLDEKITSFSKKSVDEQIDAIQQSSLAQDQSTKQISHEMQVFNSDCSKKFNELHEKLKNKEIPEGEISKLKEQLIQMHKTMNSFTSHVLANPQKSELSYYPPVKLTPTVGDPISVDFALLLHFSDTFQNMMADFDYSYSPDSQIKAFATSDHINTLVKWMNNMTSEREKHRASLGLINNLNCKELLQIADFWDIEYMKRLCELFIVRQIDRDMEDSGKLNYTKDEFEDMVSLAKRTNCEDLLSKLLEYETTVEK